MPPKLVPHSADDALSHLSPHLQEFGHFRQREERQPSAPSLARCALRHVNMAHSEAADAALAA